jgi:hypothetical protein
VPNAQHHRGAHPEDASLFSPDAVQLIRLACTEAAWLLDRGYAVNSVLDVVARRHQLRSRQRMALQRSMCSRQSREARIAKALQAGDVRGETLEIDGFNLIIGLEVALSGGPLLRGMDGALRDLAGLRGSYRPVEETELALDILGTLLDDLAIVQMHFYLDRPVSNSGRLKARILERARGWTAPASVELVANPDRQLNGHRCVVSSDSGVIDAADSWFNLLAYIIETRIKVAWVLEVGAGAQSG